MHIKRLLFIFTLFVFTFSYSQVKVGENPNTIHQSSILELESDSKVFILTRVDDTQMSRIRPLAGAMVYNTEQGCVFQYNGTTWSSLCNSTTFNETTTVLLDNKDGTLSYTNENNQEILISKSTLTNDGNGNFTFNNNDGNPITFSGTDNQDANEVLLSTPIDVDGDGTNENNVQTAIAGLANLNTDDDITAVVFDGTNLTVEEGTTSFGADLSALEESSDIAAVQTDVDQNESDADNAIAAVQTNLDSHVATDTDTDETNELSDLNLDASNILTLTNAEAGATGVDLSGFISSDDQNLESATLSATSELGINIEGGNDVTVDLSALEESSDIAAVQADVDQNEADADSSIAAVQADVDQNETDADNAIAAVQTNLDTHVAADTDTDETNELSDLNLDASNILTLTNAEAGASGVDLSGFVSTDDQNLESATLSATSELGINIEGGNDVTVDLSALEESSDIAAVQADVDQNETDADSAIATVQADVDQNETDADNAIAAVQTNLDTHVAADTDTDETNELSDLNLDASNILTLTNAEAGATGVDLSGFVSSDDQNLESATLSATSELGINIEGGNDVTVDLSALEESSDIAAVQADVDQNETDADSAIATVQADVDQNETDADNAIAAVQTNLDTHVTADTDTDETNELSDLNLDASNILTLTNAEAGATGVDLSGFVSSDDQNLESATLSATSELGINIEGGNDVTVDLSALEESADITANTNAIAAEVARATAAETAIQNDVNQNELDADNAIAAVQTNLDMHVAADTDTDETNELSDLNLDASNILTLTNAEAGATGVDLSGFVSTDDQNLESATLSATSELGINIEGGNDVTVDLSALEESSDIAAVQTDVDQNETDADSAIATVQADVDQNETDADNAIAAVQTNLDTHVAADTDTDETNELSDLNLDASNILTLTNAEAGATGVDLSGFVSSDDQNLESATLSATSELAVNIEGGNDVTVDLSALEESSDIAAVQTNLDAHVAADSDTDETNELSDLNLDASNILTLTNAEAGATGVDLSGFVSSDDQNLESATLSATSELAVNIEGGNDVTVDLSALEESADITTNTNAITAEVARATAAETAIQDDVNQNETDADNAIAAVQTNLDTHVAADSDTDETNELSLLGNGAPTVTPSNPGTTYVDETAGQLYVYNGTTWEAVGGNASPDLDGDPTNELSDLSISGTTVQLTNAAAGATGVDLNTTFATDTELSNAIIASEALDLDKDATNELSDLNLDASNILTLTNAEAGATGVDLSGFVSSDDQNLESATLSATSELGINIEGGNDVTVDLSALEESSDIAAVQTNLDTHVAADTDTDETNELSDLNLDASNVLTLTNAEAGATGVDLSGFVSSDDQNLESATLSATSELGINIEGGNDVTVDLSTLEESSDIAAVQADVDQNETDADNAIAAVQTNLDTHVAADTDTDETNELSDLNLDASNILTLTNAEAGATGVDLSGFVSTDDQNLESATLSATSELGINIEGGNDVTVDLSALEESADITANTNAIAAEVARATAAETAIQNDVNQNESDADNAIAAVQTNLDTHVAADTDTDETNELSDLNLDASNILTLTNAEAGATGVDLSGFVSTDDQNLESATLSATSELGINIEGGNDVTVDLSTLEESSDIAAVQADVDQNETDADNAIAAVQTNLDTHVAADTDTDETNELSDLNLDASNILTLTNAEAGATGVDLSGFVSSDDQNLESATLSATSELGINIEGGNDVTVDLSALEESNDIAAVQTNLDSHIAADTDTDETNELSDLNLDASNILTLTNAEAGATGVDLSGFVSSDDQNLESATLSATSELGINIEGGNDVTVDLSALEESSDIAAVQTNLDSHIAADTDTDETNELSDLNLDASNILTLTNAEAGATGVDLSGFVSTDDQNLESATLSATSELGINIEGGNDVTVDLSALEESADITTNTNAIAAEVARATAAETAIQNDVNQNETDADNAIAAVQTNLDTHIAADTDTDETNELSDLNLDASNILTLTNAEAGATGVDLSGFVSSDDQNLESATLSATSELGINIEGGNDVTVDLSALEESSDIAAVQADVDLNETDADNAIAAVQTNLDAHLAADTDTDETNELSDLNLDASNILTLTNAEAGATGVDLSGFVSTDDQNLESATLSATSELAVNIEGGNDVTVDLSALEESSDIAAVQADVDQNEADADSSIVAVQADVDQNETDADNAIAAVQTNLDTHVAADTDTDETNELSDLNLDASNILTLTNAEAGATGVDLSGFVSSDDQNLESATLSATSELGINIEGGNDVTVDLSALEESADITANTNAIAAEVARATAAETAIQNDVNQNESDADNAIAAVQTNLDTHVAADTDTDETNELSDLNLDASNILTLTNAEAGATGVDLSGFVSSDDQNLESATLSATSELGINIEGGNDVTVDLSALEESSDIATVQTNLDAHVAADTDTDETNELSDLNLDASNILTLTNAEAGATGVDLSGFVSSDDQNLESATLSATSELGINIEGGNDVTVDLSALEESSDIAAVQSNLDAHVAADTDTDETNELSDLNLDASNILTLTNAEAGATGVDLSGFVSSDDQNLESATLSATSELGINIEGGNDVTVDLSALEESSDIAAVQTDVDQNELDADNAIAAVQTNLDTHIAADTDTDETNELSDLNLDASNILTLTNAEAGATGVDLSGFVSTDDQNLESATLSATSELGINIEGGNDVTVDLSALEESNDIAAVQTNLDTHVAADTDTDETNELSDLNLDASNILTLTNAQAGATGVDLSGFVSTDDQNLESATLSATSELGINIEGGNDVTVDLSTLEESSDIAAVQIDVDQNELDADNAIAAVQTNLDSHIAADTDTDETNELSDLNLDASNILTLTNAEAGATGVDLSGFVSSDNQKIELFAFNGSTFELMLGIENDATTRTANLSSLHADGTETKIVAGDSNIIVTGDGSSTLPYGIYNNFTEVDGSITNETNTGFTTVTVSGTDYLRISDSNGDLDVPLSDLAHSGTTGSVFFADALGNPSENNSQLFWDNSSNSFGIGTASPTNKLHVTGAIRSQGLLNSNGTVNEPSYRFQADTNTGMYRPAADEIGFTVGGIQALRIDETSNNTTVIVNETLELEGDVLDTSNSPGTAGQVLSSTGTGTAWVNSMSPVKAIGKIAGGGSIIKATTGVTTSRISTGRYQVTLPSGMVSDANYIIQLTQPGRNGSGNDDPGISYSNQTTTGFQVIIGDNDNGATDRARFDSEFMFTILDL
ncbi:hypothetical protein JQC67_18040 [Aurantibacter crassamenti]|uniref:hypothetical protein n=1 Tax=Aurantibacter crassamenti TaxID=1837375 RepID=UPI001939A689|nr:hypothetical protein [Aurantibacter crassamenti]MBM1108058.1 hypothetical protein [Aurantibacter crassamenti]